MKDTTKYNGWNNYATWRVMLELFDRHTPEDNLNAYRCKELAEDLVARSARLAKDYANAFLDEVDWHEIAEAVNEEES